LKQVCAADAVTPVFLLKSRRDILAKPWLGFQPHVMASRYLKNRRNITVFLSHRYEQTSENPTLENVNDCLSHNHLKISVIALKETLETSND
jgi:hypothetical protein